MSRKRRRAEAFGRASDNTADDHGTNYGDENDVEVVVVPSANGDAISEDHEELGEAKLEKAQEIWDAFKEEHYEAVDQLPLSLQRFFDLMRELEGQVHGYNTELLPSIKAYISLRQSMVPKSNPALLTQQDEATDAAHANASDPPADAGRCATPAGSEVSTIPQTPILPTNGVALTPRIPASPFLFASGPPPGTPGALPVPEDRKNPPRTSRELLSHIAWLSEESVRAAEEKLNLAQAAYDLTDRHIRLLDQAIKEQETSLSLGLRPGTHPTSIVLPEVVAPPHRRPRQESRDLDHLNLLNGLDFSVEPISAPVAGNSKKKKPKPPTGISLKLTVPPLASLQIDENEPRYCYCNMVSFGEMIACDNDGCMREWFHLGCTQLDKPPRGKWYCRDCKEERALSHNTRQKVR